MGILRTWGEVPRTRAEGFWCHVQALAPTAISLDMMVDSA